MQNICDNPIAKKLKCACRTLSKTRIRGEYSANMSIYCEDSPSVSDASHKCEGTVDQSLVKALALIGAVAVFASVICCIRSLFRH